MQSRAEPNVAPRPSVGATAAVGGADLARRVVVVSLQKSGTHLVQELMHALGYGIYGLSRIGPEMRPRFDREQRLRIARLVLEDADYEHLRREPDARAFERETDRAWETVGWMWQRRLGVPIYNRYGNATFGMIEDAFRRTGFDRSRFAETPAGVCWIVHDLRADKVDGDFIEEWAASNTPRIILNYRDPRDVMVSFVNYLSGGTGRGFGRFHEFKLFSRVLESLGSFEERLTYALRDPCFPGHGDLARALWLFHHPEVCKVSFEELVGPAGGGSQELQRAAIARICRHLDIHHATDELGDLSARIYNRDAFTFFKGRTGGWREVFTQQHRELYAAAFGAIHRIYGYAD